LCGSKLTCKHAHIDHKLPRSRGGQDTWGNLHATHARCNLRKGALTIQEFKSLFA
jgi:5-methylcytosine-specific restriction endonuclease McrA